MKKFLLSFLALIGMVNVAVAQSETNYLSVSDIELQPGESKEISVNMTNDLTICTVECHFVLPEGLSVVAKQEWNEDDEEYVTFYATLTSRKHSSHTLYSSVTELSDGSNELTVLICSGSNKTFKGNDGSIFTFELKAAEDAALKIYQVKMSGMELTSNVSNELGQISLDDKEVNVNVYKNCTVKVSSADETMGQIKGGNISETYKSGEEITVGAITNDGYHFVEWSNGETANPYTFTVNDDIDLTAKFAPNQWTVTFDIDGNKTSSLMNYGEPISAPEVPAKEGYTFKGWDPELDATVPNCDVTYTAVYEINKYTVKFVVDGKEIYKEELKYGTAITAPADPTKIGYDFLGWDPKVDATVPAKDVTYTAQFKAHQWKVTFVVDGEETTTTQDYGTAITAPEDPEKEGYTFKGWDPKVDATVPDEDRTYTAVFEINKHTITFVIDDESTTTTQDYGTAIVAPEKPTKEGYTFNGWEPEVAATVPDEDVTYTAVFTVNSYVLTVNVAGVDGYADQTAELSVNFASVIKDEIEKAIEAGELSVPEGYEIIWADGTPETMPAGVQTINGQLAKIQYRFIQFLVDEEAVDFTYNGETVKTVKFKPGEAIEGVKYPAEPSKTGYTFTGWNPATLPATMGQDNIDVVAQFTINSYDVTFVVDGEETTTNQNYGTDITAPADPTKVGYTFKEWNPTVDATVPDHDVTYTAVFEINKNELTVVLAGLEGVKEDQTWAGKVDYNTPIYDYVNNVIAENFEIPAKYEVVWPEDYFETMPDDEYTLNLALQEIPFRTITFVVDGEVVEFTYNGETVDHVDLKPGESTYGINYPADPVKEGYTFSGWSEEIPEEMPTDDVTIEALFKVNTYVITYYIDGEEYKSVAVEYGASVPNLSVPEVEGYTFSGWYNLPETMPAEDIDVYGKYDINWNWIEFAVTEDGETHYYYEWYYYGEEIYIPSALEKEGYTLHVEQGLPETMPDYCFGVTCHYDINYHRVTWVLALGSEDNTMEVKSDYLPYGAELPENPLAPLKFGYEFIGWDDAPATMPDYDVVIYARYDVVTGIFGVMTDGNETCDVYSVDGKVVLRNASAAEINAKLAPGMYIINNKKVILK